MTAPPTYTRQLSNSSGSSYASPMEYTPAPLNTRKRNRRSTVSLDYAEMRHMDVDMPFQLTATGHHAQPQAGSISYRLPSQSTPQNIQPVPSTLSQGQMTPATTFPHHHHHLPDQPPPVKIARLEHAESDPPFSPDRDTTHISVVGRQDMPSPAARPKGPKLKFTAEDDTLLVELKETKNLTWKQIADFFPGRSSGTLQVRYCTKLKAKKEGWSGEMVSSEKAHMTRKSG